MFSDVFFYSVSLRDAPPITRNWICNTLLGSGGDSWISGFLQCANNCSVCYLLGKKWVFFLALCDSGTPPPFHPPAFAQLIQSPSTVIGIFSLRTAMVLHSGCSSIHRKHNLTARCTHISNKAPHQSPNPAELWLGLELEIWLRQSSRLSHIPPLVTLAWIVPAHNKTNRRGGRGRKPARSPLWTTS